MKMLFIGGTGRCGTNVTKYLMDLHPDTFSFPFEIRLLIDEDGLCEFYRNVKEYWTPQKIHIRFQRMKKFLYNLGEKGKEGRYQGWNLSNDAFPKYYFRVDEFLKELETFSFEGFWDWMPEKGSIPYVSPKTEKVRIAIRKFFLKMLNDVVEERGLNRETAVYVDDGTYNMFYASILNELFPESVLLHMIREPTQVIGSMMDSVWCPGDAGECSIWYVDSWNGIKDILEQIPEEVLLEMNMEELIEEPLKNIEMICSALGIPLESKFKKKILEFDLSRQRKYNFGLGDKEKINEILRNRN